MITFYITFSVTGPCHNLIPTEISCHLSYFGVMLGFPNVVGTGKAGNLIRTTDYACQTRQRNFSSSIELSKALSTLATIVAEFGDCRQNRRLSPNSPVWSGFKRWKTARNYHDIETRFSQHNTYSVNVFDVSEVEVVDTGFELIQDLVVASHVRR